MKTRIPAAAAALLLLVGGARPTRATDPAGPIIETVVGGGTAGDGELATRAGIYPPNSVGFDSSGSLLIGDNSALRLIDASTGLISTLVPGYAGQTGYGTYSPHDLGADAFGNVFFRGDAGSRVFKRDTAGTISVAEPGSGAISGLAVDPAGNLYFPDGSYRILKRSPAGIVTILATGIPAVTAVVYRGGDLFLGTSPGSASASRVYRMSAGGGPLVALGGGVSVSGGPLVTIAGSGGPLWTDGAFATTVSFQGAQSLAVDPAGNVYISEQITFHRVLKVEASTGRIYLFAGGGMPPSSSPRTICYAGVYVCQPISDGTPARYAPLYEMAGITADDSGAVFIAEYGGHRVWRVGTDGLLTCVAGDGIPQSSWFGEGVLGVHSRFQASAVPSAFAPAPDGSLVIAAGRSIERIRRWDALSQRISTLAGTGVRLDSGDGGPAVSASVATPEATAIDAAGNVYFLTSSYLRVIDAATGTIRTITAVSYGTPRIPLLKAEHTGTLLVVSAAGLRRIDPTTGITSTLPGRPYDGLDLGTDINGVAVAPDGTIYASHRYYHQVDRIDRHTGAVTRVAGLGVHSSAGFSGDGGPGTLAALNTPAGLAVDEAGNLFIGDTVNHRVRRLDAVTGIITTVAGSGAPGGYPWPGYAGDGGPALSAQLNNPCDVEVDGLGNLYIYDQGAGTATYSDRIRRVPGVAATRRDSTAPTLTVPGDQVLEATSGSGAVATFAATATDAVTAVPTIAYSAASGSTFALGTTTVTVTATDAAGNASAGTFTVTVRDTTAPALTLPGSQVVEATSASGAVATFAATATDAVTAAPTITYSAAPGGTFALGTTTVTVTATDAAGNVSHGTFTVTVRDTTAPDLTVPGDLLVEATGAGGAAVTFAATATDGVTAVPTIAYSASCGSTFPLGTTTVYVAAIDAAGNVDSASFDVTVRDTTPPAFSLPVVYVEATGPTGAVATFFVTAYDLVDGPVAVTCTATSGGVFALGATSVSCTAIDSRGNVAHGSFSVTVHDRTAPSVVAPPDMTVEAAGPAGAAATFTATAVDLVSGSVPVTFAPVSGSTFALGATIVTCTATDAAGNVGSGSFTVTVRDTTAPALTLPSGVTAEATSAAGAVVTFSASASDLVDGAIGTVTCSPASGTLFALGTTGVTCTATDVAGNTGTGTFTVSVADTTAPMLTLPANVIQEATSASGAVATFTSSAADAVDGAVDVTCSPAAGSTFALGTTTVTCTATDTAGNTGSRSFTVTIRDTTAPSLALPSGIVVEAASSAGAVVTFDATASDLVDGNVTVTSDPASGSTFPLGTTTVPCSATDDEGNTATGQFTVTVGDSTAPALTLPADVMAEATSASGAVVTFSASANDLVDGAVTVTCSPSSGSTFASGTTTVACTATDSEGNSATGSFSVTVRDTTAPALSVPADLTVEATSAAGAVVSYSATATDAVSSPTVVTTPASGTQFALGTWTVSCTATDAAGNVATGSFHVTVRDTTAPSLSVTDVPSTLWPPNHQMVRIHPTVAAFDLGDPAPAVDVSVTCNETLAAGDVVVHSPGDIELRAERVSSGSGRVYTLVFRATDSSGNQSTAKATVTVPKSQGK